MNTGYNGNFNRHMQPIRRKSGQVWEVGSVVNVGFLKGLKIIEKTVNGWALRSANGAEYYSEPHSGIYRTN